MSDLDLICADFNGALAFLRGAGARLDVIFPADAPHSAVLTHEGRTVRLRARADVAEPPSALPPFEPEFVVTRAGDACEGRAGMRYRDLIPSRLGGRYIASHIAVEDGPVADWVHYHRVAFQLICVRRGWVRVAYEDQGEPFVMAEGDMVLQPPGIRHRVLESGGGLEVVEIGCPALHETFAEHAMALPNGEGDPERRWEAQRFLHHRAAAAPWTRWRGGEAQETGLAAATGGVADARIVRLPPGGGLEVPPYRGELVFGFVFEGSARLEHEGPDPLGPADAFVVPPGKGWGLRDASPDFRLLHVTTEELPG
ncbi:MAG: cupin [Alphaproteobacteria bacterium]|nr:cupin [Alphaproteobacteria bacterium]